MHEDHHGTSDTENPLLVIESDLYGLMKSLGNLQHMFNEHKDKSENEMRKLMLDFISVSDALGNVLSHVEPKLDSAPRETKIWMNSVKTVNKLIQRTLASWGIVQVETIIGEKVNPYWHSVFETVQNADRVDETILEEVKKGYLWNGKLLRTAEVIAVKNDN